MYVVGKKRKKNKEDIDFERKQGLLKVPHLCWNKIRILPVQKKLNSLSIVYSRVTMNDPIENIHIH